MIIDLKSSGDKDDDTAAGDWLRILGSDFVDNFLEGETDEFLGDINSALGLGALKGEEGIRSVKTAQTCPVGVKCIVVVWDELLSNSCVVGHLELCKER